MLIHFLFIQAILYGLGHINTFKSPDSVSNCYSCTMGVYEQTHDVYNVKEPAW